MYRKTIVAAFQDVLDASHTPYRVSTPRKGTIVISFPAKVPGRLSAIFSLFEFCRAQIRIIAIPFPPLQARNLPEMFKLLAMVNQRMDVGCFALETEPRCIRFRHLVDCRGFAELPKSFVADLLLLPLQALGQYGDAFAAVSDGSSDAETAFAAACPAPQPCSPRPQDPTTNPNPLSAAVLRFLRKTQWPTPDFDGPSIHCPDIPVPNNLQTVSLTIDIGDSGLRVCARPPLLTPKQRIGAMAEFLALVNYELLIGHFDLDVHTGEISFRLFLDCSGFEKIPPVVLKRHLPIPLLMFREFGDALSAVATAATTPAAAFAQSRQSPLLSPPS